MVPVHGGALLHNECAYFSSAAAARVPYAGGATKEALWPCS